MLINIIDHSIKKLGRRDYTFLQLCPESHPAILIPKKEIIELPEGKTFDISNEVEKYLDIDPKKCSLVRVSFDIRFVSKIPIKRLSSRQLIKLLTDTNPTTLPSFLVTLQERYQITITDEDFEVIFTQLKSNIADYFKHFSFKFFDQTIINKENVNVFKHIIREYVALKKYGWVESLISV